MEGWRPYIRSIAAKWVTSGADAVDYSDDDADDYNDDDDDGGEDYN